MISTINVKCNAAKPNFPLQPMFAFQGSPSSIRILDVPKSIGEWAITSVKVAIEYPDNTTIEKSAVRNGSVWVATIEGCEIAGKVLNGYSVLADGKDEDGNDVTGYVLGKGDVYIIENDTDISRLLDKIAVRYVEDIPDVPTKGDLMNSNGELRLFDGNDWILISTGEHSVVYNSQITIQKNGTSVGSFTVNASEPKNIDIPVPSNTSDLVNDSGFITVEAIPSDISSFNNDVGYITASALPTKVSELENDSGFITLAQVPTPSYIEDATGNRINANLSCTYIDNAWEVTDPSSNKHILEYVGFIQSYHTWECVEPENIKLVLTYANDWALQVYTWQEVGAGGDHDWVLDISGAYNGASDITTIPYFVNAQTTYNYSAQRPVTKHLTLATKDELPTKTSDLVNDSGFITASAIPSNVSQLTNDSGYLTSQSRTITTLQGNFSNHEQRLRTTEKDATGAREYMDLTYPTVNADAQDGFGIASFNVYFPAYDGKVATEATLGTITESSGTVLWSGAFNLEVKSSDGIHFSYYNNGNWSELPVNANGTEAWTNFYAQGIRPAYVTPSFKSNTMKKIALEDYVDASLADKRGIHDNAIHPTSVTNTPFYKVRVDYTDISEEKMTVVLEKQNGSQLVWLWQDNGQEIELTYSNGYFQLSYQNITDIDDNPRSSFFGNFEITNPDESVTIGDSYFRFTIITYGGEITTKEYVDS